MHTRLATFHRVVMVQVLKEVGYLAQFLILSFGASRLSFCSFSGQHLGLGDSHLVSKGCIVAKFVYT